MATMRQVSTEVAAELRKDGVLCEERISYWIDADNLLLAKLAKRTEELLEARGVVVDMKLSLLITPQKSSKKKDDKDDRRSHPTPLPEKSGRRLLRTTHYSARGRIKLFIHDQAQWTGLGAYLLKDGTSAWCALREAFKDHEVLDSLSWGVAKQRVMTRFSHIKDEKQRERLAMDGIRAVCKTGALNFSPADADERWPY